MVRVTDGNTNPKQLNSFFRNPETETNAWSADGRKFFIDLSESFLYAANNTGNTVSGFQVDRTSGVLTQLADSPYPAGTGPTSITVVNSLQ